MRHHSILLLALLGTALVGLPTAGHGQPASTEPVVLQVKVEVPPFWAPFLDDRVAEAFVDRLRESMRVMGYDGKVFFLKSGDTADPDAPQLTISLVEWRINHLGDIACSFTAYIQTPEKVKQLGFYTNRTMVPMVDPDRFGLTRVFEEAAEGAVRALARDIARSHLLPRFEQ